jgi:hypothetical protein
VASREKPSIAETTRPSACAGTNWTLRVPEKIGEEWTVAWDVSGPRAPHDGE